MVRLSAQGRHLRQVAELVQELPEVLQCYRVTGDACYLLIVAAADMEHLERLLDRLSFYGQTNTSMVVSTPLDRRVVTGTVRETPPKT
ncbi:Lrp/AsnC ligand binding domain-containing protein [Calidithermus chliarophilus]|uniref:Lrp/AsnC ligand binding domain-containing protein n=1 Tax=Calidithermus chliarophilus TaxID=52023 RepID=UPI001FDF532E|nr:Lrp/AsnC ligand binding domain-containing protein [Calidithermus chliarophilus]